MERIFNTYYREYGMMKLKDSLKYTNKEDELVLLIEYFRGIDSGDEIVETARIYDRLRRFLTQEDIHFLFEYFLERIKKQYEHLTKVGFIT